MHYIIYQSRALIPQGSDEHRVIMSQCQTHNRDSGLTGFLHREGDFFVQYIEGPKEKLDQTIARIRKDPRHTDLIILDEQPLDSRKLPDWQMGFVKKDQFRLKDLIEMDDEGLDLKFTEPFDLVVFMVANADMLRAAA
ncbi:MAG: BLUF domain-containing protein [Sedimentitalea sp.]